MNVDPLKSALSLGNVDDTSLAVPSVQQRSSGQRRVLQQVETMRRSRSKSSSSRSASSFFGPTSPTYEPVFLDPVKPSLSNGSVFVGNGLSRTLSYDANAKRQLATNNNNNQFGASVKRTPPSVGYQYEKRSYTTLGNMAAGHNNNFINNDSSRSDLERSWQRSMTARSTAPPPRYLSGGGGGRERPTSMILPAWTGQVSQVGQVGQVGRQTSHSTIHIKTVNQVRSSSQPDGPKAPGKQTVAEVATKEEEGTNGHGGSGGVDLTMKEAVECLSSGDETHQHCGASFIQHNSFISEDAKDEVLKLGGVPPLVALLQSPSAQVCQTAAAALRNLSFRSGSNKEAIHRRGGITEAAALLRDTDSAELQKQLTGLLWNLSSSDELKPELLKSALPPLVERVIVPYTTGPDRDNGACQDPEVFYYATACLRNLSSSKQNNRQVMRKCRGLIDSLVSYMSDCVEAGRVDDKSLENCVCVLHNLTFQLEAEAPALFSGFSAASRQPIGRSGSVDEGGPIGCFSKTPAAASEQNHYEIPTVAENPRPSGAAWLFHSRTLQCYLDLLASSPRVDTQEACCGALHNLTTHDGTVSKVMGQTLVNKLNGLEVLCPFLQSDRVNLQRSSVALVGNLTKNPGLHKPLARTALTELVGIINGGTEAGNESDDTLSMACRASNCLVVKEPDIGKKVLNRTLINSLRNLSQNNYFPKASTAASLFLCHLWSDKDLQSFLKKQRLEKGHFINDVTLSAVQALQAAN